MTKGTEQQKKHEPLNPKNDFLFKKLFAGPGNEDLQDKEAIMDILARTSEGTPNGFNKGRAEGEAKGRAEGRAEGLTEGKIKAKQDDIYKFLAGRFGIDPAGIQEKVQQLTDLNLFGRRFD